MREDSITHEHMHALRHKSSAIQSTDQSTAICRLIVLEPVHDLLSNSAKKAKWMNCRLVLS
ncbi:hypothetical protein VDG05_05000, partial [Xanthomonas campestris pv. raphani]|uniref:hypothetical protein n=1 Tax=Xanthomonas campestris TaxID=339 RepID=UPI002B223C3B